MARRNHDLIIYDTVTGERKTVTPSPVGAFVNRRHVPTLSPEHFHLAQTFERSLYCEQGSPWTPTDLANFLEPEVLAFVTGTFTVDHWMLSHEGFAMLDAPKILFPGNVFVRVFHDAISPLTNQCDRCGVTVGTPIQRAEFEQAG